MNCYRVDVERMKATTSLMTVTEELAYRRLLDRYYLTERPLRGSVEFLARQIGMGEHQTEVAGVLSAHFTRSKQGEWRDAWADWQIKKHKKSQRA